jgi:hypothetical protein
MNKQEFLAANGQHGMNKCAGKYQAIPPTFHQKFGIFRIGMVESDYLLEAQNNLWWAIVARHHVWCDGAFVRPICKEKKNESLVCPRVHAF